jgi:V-type H+-transporting ATPase subunit a
MTLQKVLEKDFNVIVMGILLFFVFAVFAFVTLGVMLCMDTLECFLHALRLQW